MRELLDLPESEVVCSSINVLEFMIELNRCIFGDSASQTAEEVPEVRASLLVVGGSIQTILLCCSIFTEARKAEVDTGVLLERTFTSVGGAGSVSRSFLLEFRIVLPGLSHDIGVVDMPSELPGMLCKPVFEVDIAVEESLDGFSCSPIAVDRVGHRAFVGVRVSSTRCNDFAEDAEMCVFLKVADFRLPIFDPVNELHGEGLVRGLQFVENAFVQQMRRDFRMTLSLIEQEVASLQQDLWERSG